VDVSTFSQQQQQQLEQQQSQQQEQEQQLGLEQGQEQGQQLWPCCCPKTLPDFESAGACWVSLDELQGLPLRSPSEPCRWFPALASGEAAQLPLYNSLEMPAEWEAVFAGYPFV
jgi:transcription initiation factor TFIID subunit TAF12